MLFRAESSESKGFDDRMLHENQPRHVYSKGRHAHSHPFFTDVSLSRIFYVGIDLN